MTERVDPGTRWVVIVDHDAKEFQIEGPMYPDATRSWMDAVQAAADQGRNILATVELGNKDRTYIRSLINQRHGYPELGTFRLPNSN